jgi:hypothetical protein
MAFRCGFCNKAQEAGTSPVMVVTETRAKNYPERRKQTRMGNKVIDKGGQGSEIVSEVRACEKCASSHAQ